MSWQLCSWQMASLWCLGQNIEKRENEEKKKKKKERTEIKKERKMKE